MPASTTNEGTGVRVLAVGQVDAVIAVSVAGITATITLTVPGGGIHWYRIWLSDSSTDPTESLYAPTGGGATSWEGFTDSDGEATIAFANNAASRSWYVWARLEKTNVSAVLTVGT